MAAVLATWELEGRHGDFYPMEDGLARAIATPYFDEALSVIRRHRAAADDRW